MLIWWYTFFEPGDVVEGLLGVLALELPKKGMLSKEQKFFLMRE